jgi:hypothetical protein
MNTPLAVFFIRGWQLPLSKEFHFGHPCFASVAPAPTQTRSAGIARENYPAPVAAWGAHGGAAEIFRLSMTVARLDELFINRAELPVIEPRQDIVIHKSKATAVVWDTGIESGYIIRTGKKCGYSIYPDISVFGLYVL